MRQTEKQKTAPRPNNSKANARDCAPYAHTLYTQPLTQNLSHIEPMGVLNDFQYLYTPPAGNYRCSNSAACWAYCMRIWDHGSIAFVESMQVIFLDASKRIITHKMVALGSPDCAVIPVNLIVKIAITTMAQGVVLAHNHPNEQLQPSESDIDVTRHVKDLLSDFNIVLVDHIILSTTEQYFSFADSNLI